MKTRHLAHGLNHRIHPIALGCMNFSHAYGAPVPREQALSVLHAALDAGVTMFDTAALYGFGSNEQLVGPALAPHRGRIVLASKGGMTGQPVGPGGALQRVIDGNPQSIRRDCEASLQRLGTDHIDLYYLHRWDKRVPIEDSVGEMARLQAEGKIGALGLSEVSAATLRRAFAVAPIAALQSEYSLWSRNAELGCLQACRELGVAYVAFSPVGRGVLGALAPDTAAFDAKDIRRSMPRFAAEHYPHNLALMAQHRALAAEQGCTPAQLALAFVLAQGDRVVALPGTTQLEHLHDNLGAVNLTLDADTLQRLATLWHPRAASGARYNSQGLSEVDTEEYPA
ncbi:MAG: aldo/keto reductase [Rubrivivax sp.]|nr:aldo/keto reductase [Rubrivivax sp.]